MRHISLLFFICTSFLVADVEDHAAVTYAFKGSSRFGDKLLLYLHAKWIAYKYDIPLLYKPFKFSKYLVLDDKEIPYSVSLERKFKETLLFSKKNDMNLFLNSFEPADSILLTIPYFIDLFWINQVYPLKVDFDDPGFRKLIKRLIAPKNPIPFSIRIPKGRFSVAAHVRTGGAKESKEMLYAQYSVKAPRPYFYVEQLKFLYQYLERRPLFVYIFTDDANPLDLQRYFEKELIDLDIQFACRSKGNAHNKNVLEDFFAMARFDGSIHGDSNYSNCAGFIADYRIEIRAIDILKDGRYLSRMRITHDDGTIEYIDRSL